MWCGCAWGAGDGKMREVRRVCETDEEVELQAVAVNSLGKWKTAAQMVALTLLLAGRDGGYVMCLEDVGEGEFECW